MSVLGPTEFGVVLICARAVHVLEGVRELSMTKDDDGAVTLARSKLLSVVESNGYRLEVEPFRLLKTDEKSV